MRIKVVTSFNKKLWDKYAKTTIASWVTYFNLDPGSDIEIWLDGSFPKGLPMQTSNGTPFKYRMIETQSESWQYFYSTHAGHPRPNVDDGQTYRFNFLPYSIKVFALAEAAFKIKESETLEYDYLLWLDADVLLTKTVDTEYLKSIINNKHIAWLDRGPPWGHGETGFILASTQNNTLDIFLEEANVYGSGQLFYFAEWHDAFIFTALMRHQTYVEADQLQVVNLNNDMKSEHKNGLYPFETSVLNSHMIHYKGNTKENVTQ